MKRRSTVLLAIVTGTGTPRPSDSGASVPVLNESVTDCSNQQFMPALTPHSTRPAPHARARSASRRCARHTASRLAVFPPPTYRTSEVRRTAVQCGEGAVEPRDVTVGVPAGGRHEANARGRRASKRG